MRFDRTSPGEGVEVRCRLENGKAYLEWSFAYAEPEEETGQRGLLQLFVRDRQGNVVLECRRAPEEEEPMESILLQPKLWRGVKEPYLYSLEAVLSDREGKSLDRLSRQLALYRLEERGGLFLNGESFEKRAVRYKFPEAASPAELQRIVAGDLQRLRELGANCIYLEGREGPDRPFLQLCERIGFLVYSACGCVGPDNQLRSESGSIGSDRLMRPEKKESRLDVPTYRGGNDSLVSLDGAPSSEFYRYKARWGSDSFVYIVPESVRRQENGSFSATVYSSCGRVALYSDGVLHEFRSGSGEFLFREIPVKGPYLNLTAEGEGCAQSLSLHRTFTKLSPFDDN